MPNRFEVLDTDGQMDVSIEVKAGHEWEGMDCDPGTDFVIKPPLTIDEQLTFIDSTGHEDVYSTTIGSLVTGGIERVGISTTYNAEHEPSDEQLAFGVELAKVVLAVKGLKTAKVLMASGETIKKRVVLAIPEAPESSPEQ